MFVEAVNYLRNSYATDKVIAKEASMMESFKKFSNQKAVKFATDLKENAL